MVQSNKLHSVFDMWWKQRLRKLKSRKRLDPPKLGLRLKLWQLDINILQILTIKLKIYGY